MRSKLPAISLLALLATSCAKFSTVIFEFDAVTGLDLQTGEPAELRYNPAPLRWPWFVRWTSGSGLAWCSVFFFGAAPSPQPVENPSGYARERLIQLPGLTEGDLVRNAQVASRLLWVAEADQEHALNQVIAIRGMAFIMRAFKIDPLSQPLPAEDRPETRASYLADRRILAAQWPNRRGGTPRGEDRRAYLAALERLSARPAAQPRQGRDLLRDLSRRLPEEGDGELYRATKRALQGVLRMELSEGLRQRLRSPSALLREEATLAICELGGPPAAAYCLAALQRRSTGAARFDPSYEMRLVLVRICGQLQGELLDQTYAFSPGMDGPSPLRFLYETARADRVQGLRIIAQEAIAFCLDRPVSFEESEIDQWWLEHLSVGVNRGQ